MSKRETISYYYDDDGNSKGGGVSEEILFNKKGNRIQHTRFLTSGDIEYKFKYKYDEENKEIEMSSYDAEDNLLLTKTFEYNEEKVISKIHEQDFLQPLKGREHVYTYTDSLVNYREIKNSEGGIILHEITTYDSLGYVLAKIKSDPNIGKITTYYVHDDLGNISEIVAPYYKVKMTYDEKGNVITEELYDVSSKQHTIVYEYDDNGLLLEKTRYDTRENPLFRFEYKYEFY